MKKTGFGIPYQSIISRCMVGQLAWTCHCMQPEFCHLSWRLCSILWRWVWPCEIWPARIQSSRESVQPYSLASFSCSRITAWWYCQISLVFGIVQRPEVILADELPDALQDGAGAADRDFRAEDGVALVVVEDVPVVLVGGAGREHQEPAVAVALVGAAPAETAVGVIFLDRRGDLVDQVLVFRGIRIVLVAAGPHRHRRVVAQALDHVDRVLDEEILRHDRVVRAGEPGLRPAQDALAVADPVERLGLLNPAGPDAEQVDVGVFDLVQVAEVPLLLEAEHVVHWHPVGAADEHALAVHHEDPGVRVAHVGPEPVGLLRGFQRPQVIRVLLEGDFANPELGLHGIDRSRSWS